MKSQKTNLQAALVVGSVVLTAGGGKLIDIAPPGEYEAIFSGIISLFLLAALGMSVKGFARSLFEITGKDSINKLIWSLVVFISVFVFARAAITYYETNIQYVVSFTSGQQNTVVDYVVTGDQFTSLGQMLNDKNPLSTYADLIGDAGGIDKVEIVWTRESISSVRANLMREYIVMIVAVGMMLFSGVELITQTNSGG